MTALMQLISGSFGWRTRSESSPKTTVRETIRSAPKRDMVGEFYADYSGLSADQLNESDPEMDDLLRRSRVVSANRGL